MSFFCYLTLERCCVLAADNKKHVVTVKTTGEGRSTVHEVTTGDARKIFPLGTGWWMTGVGLAAFLQEVRQHVQKALQGSEPGLDPAAAVLEKIAESPDELRCLYRRRVEALREGLPAESGRIEALEGLQDIVLVGFDAASFPVILRSGSDADFAFRRWCGPGITGFSGENGAWDPAVVERIRLFLGDVVEDLQQCPPSQIGDRAWDLIPPLFQWLARAFPQRLSAHGDLVCLTPHEHQWLLF
uniref:Uncharacterized protein n=1 Tax=Desulfacinum infernum TaxID=35837 RepID=A0A832EK22_9BACT